MKEKMNCIFEKAVDRLLELLDKKASTKEEVDAIKVLSDLIIGISYRFYISQSSRKR